MEETWTSSIDDEDLNKDQDHDDNDTSWQEVPIKFEDISIFFNNVYFNIQYGYIKEVKEIKIQLLHEYNAQTSDILNSVNKLNIN